MKILSNKTYRALVEYESLYHNATDNLFKLNDKNDVMIKKLETTRKKLREANKTMRGMEKQLSIYEKEKAELEKKLEESMSGKYLKKTLPPDKPYSTFGIKVKSNAVRSKIAKSIRESD